MREWIAALPKVELHLHIEGTLEPELMFELASRNGVSLPFDSVEAVRQAYEFDDLQSFLDIYYQGAAVLRTEADFRDLAFAYFERAEADNVRHAEIFFDPQTHTEHGVDMGTVVAGLRRAMDEALERFDMTTELILCILRHLDEDAAFATLEAAAPYQEHIVAIGLDSAERGNPPSKFERVFARAREMGFLTVAHAGEEGPAAYIRDSLDLLGVARIDHGVRCLEDDALVERLARERIPLTVCPLSNVKLRVFDRIEEHNLRTLMDRGLVVTVNSDDPAYFGGYIGENFRAVHAALGLDRADLLLLARNAVEASFATQARCEVLLAEIAGLE